MNSDGNVSAEARQSLLGQFRGERPEAPEWFEWATSIKPERSTFNHEGAEIETLVWGEKGKPGLIFLHGDSAHADWWSFIAPFFAENYRCAAISWSGMGGSGWRDSYSFDQYGDELLAAIDHAGLDNGEGVIAVAHSLGGYPAYIASAKSKRIRGVITVDTVLLPASLFHIAPTPAYRPHKAYTDYAEALSRFRFLPPQVKPNHYAIDHIARHGLREVKTDDGQKAWSWRFDPAIWKELDRRDLELLPAKAQCPLVVMRGALSMITTDKELSDYQEAHYAPDTPYVFIPDAGHHVLVDQPLALVAALRSTLAVWPKS